ncbi:hypothetical protein A0J61_10524 [Choanephora cucurbitarum]|uniref:Uncharacterized protein n=1 Tax=Choanephora cucurbitarum TaxID=101091 RepID=A0A1C7MXD8_9FUNG|nr:hypothetical protein A0J61_10524 [Choanephora cucurbitarum]
MAIMLNQDYKTKIAKQVVDTSSHRQKPLNQAATTRDVAVVSQKKTDLEEIQSVAYDTIIQQSQTMGETAQNEKSRQYHNEQTEQQDNDKRNQQDDAEREVEAMSL